MRNAKLNLLDIKNLVLEVTADKKIDVLVKAAEAFVRGCLAV